MDAQAFDRLIAEAARRPSRRAMLAAVVAALLSAALPSRAVRADHSDVDGDQLFDEDEVEVYGTDPNDADTDNDTVNDGEEIWNRDQGLGGNTNPLVNEHAAPPPAEPAPAPAPTCSGLGGACAQFSDCCAGQYVQCCFNASGIGDCQDVSQHSFVCTGWADVPATGCAVGLTNCGGFCTNLSTDNGNCGSCGQSCPGDSYCNAGACTKLCNGVYCGVTCTDISNDPNNCGACGHRCGAEPDGTPIGCSAGYCNLPY